jgi:hypothetical protein
MVRVVLEAAPNLFRLVFHRSRKLGNPIRSWCGLILRRPFENDWVVADPRRQHWQVLHPVRMLPVPRPEQQQLRPVLLLQRFAFSCDLE